MANEITQDVALKELARRELARRQQPNQQPSFMSQLGQATMNLPTTITRGVAEPFVKAFGSAGLGLNQMVGNKVPEYDVPFLGGPIPVRNMQNPLQATGLGLQGGAMASGSGALGGAMYGGGGALEQGRDPLGVATSSLIGGALGGAADVAIRGDKAIPEYVKSTYENLKKGIHDSNWIERNTYNVQSISKSIPKALGDVYRNFHAAYGTAEMPVLPISVPEGMLPKATIAKIQNDVGQIQNVGQLQESTNIINNGIRNKDWLEGGENASALKKNMMDTWIKLKENMRQSIAKVSPEAEKELAEIDSIAHNDIYPIVDKLNDIVSQEKIPSSKGLLRVMKKPLESATERGMIATAPEKIGKLKSFYESEEFTKDLNSLINKSVELSNKVSSFSKRQSQKSIATLGLEGGVGGLIVKLLGKR